MMHQRRSWCVSPAPDAQQLARLLTGHTWTLCTGFELAGYLFLNDSTSEDAAQEYAVVRKPTAPGEPYRQVESITVSWCSYAQLLDHVRQAVSGAMDGNSFACAVTPTIQSPGEHGRCHLCA